MQDNTKWIETTQHLRERAMSHPLEAIGGAPGSGDVYAALVGRGPSHTPELAQDLRMETGEVTAALATLRGLGLVSELDDGRVLAVTPRTALEAVARDHAHKAAQARAAADDLAGLWTLHQGRADYLEIVPSLAAARDIQARVLAESESHIRALSIGSNDRPRMAEGLADTLDRGIFVRAIYGAEVLRNPAALDVVQQCIAHGEHSRVFPGVPMNLLISDDRFALIVVRVPTERGADGIVVHTSDLLDTFVGVFEAFWRLAVPVSSSTTPSQVDKESTETQRLLTNLAAGLTDKAIARDLDVSERTVRRRISQLQELLGAQTRFQLGVQASRHGWL